ncbi:hypothetical protein HPB48_010959 [Haemaphysalis longicornis]|uniref:COP9 signalosome complex subunit 7 helix I domain-containing protein n=1 Tax=Haemaphysalis longicornis TaxID=44386 RepID=A0A9J6GPZ0_HAELO|nr:hypothetical protein HPB48_010959 [Haemaphysalis longicornis]
MAENKSPMSAMQSSQLEQYLLLAKTAKGAAAAELIKQVTEAPGVHVFGELLDMQNIQELANGPHSSYLNLLNLFAFGTYAAYHENKDQFPPLTPAMITKLRHLTIVSLATKTKVMSGCHLASACWGTIRTGVAIKWCTSCETVLNNIECQIGRANAMKDSHMKQKQHIENEVASIKKNLKVQSQDVDDQMGADGRDDCHMDKPGKKQSKGKGSGQESCDFALVTNPGLKCWNLVVEPYFMHVGKIKVCCRFVELGTNAFLF